ncbi:MAG: nucleotidyltransferase family protein [Phycisphaerales bacterium]|nr:MAG: nucleotidyltransferase family protein [Phycisphaerales bacterium]
MKEINLSRDQPVRIWGIIPAAGIGRRIGRPKQALPYAGSTIVGTVTRTLLDAGVTGVVVVTRNDLVKRLDLPDDDRVGIAINDDADSEMIDSIRIALAGLAGAHLPLGVGKSPSPADGVLVVPADMPTITADACRKCMAAFITDPRRIVIATYQGLRGHPIIFPLSLRPTVDSLTQGLRQLARIHPDRVRLVETGEPGVTEDIDTLEDYERL